MCGQEIAQCAPDRLRALLQRRGERFETDNDSEVAARYFAWRMREGASLEEAMRAAERLRRSVAGLEVTLPAVFVTTTVYVPAAAD